jgi:hypothetical protein
MYEKKQIKLLIIKNHQKINYRPLKKINIEINEFLLLLSFRNISKKFIFCVNKVPEVSFQQQEKGKNKKQ